jgi:hypothetical protein
MSVFMAIPHGVVRGLATKLLYLGEEDEVGWVQMLYFDWGFGIENKANSCCWNQGG